MSEMNTENIVNQENINNKEIISSENNIVENEENQSQEIPVDAIEVKEEIVAEAIINNDKPEEIVEDKIENENTISVEEAVPIEVIEEKNIEELIEDIVPKVEEDEGILTEENASESIDEVKTEEVIEGQDEIAEEKKEEETHEKPSWYIIHTYSGHEYKVKERIEQRSQAMNMTNKITKVIVPEEESVEIKNNKRQEKTNKMFPGYVFVEMVLDNETWFLIRKIPGVSKFLGPKSQPLPVTEKEMLRVLQQTGVKTKKIEVDFEIGELIKVISGPFRGYQGGINEIFPDRGKLKAKISIFGRETPVELDFDQVEKVIK